MNPLNRQWFYRGFRKRLAASLGRDATDRLWEEAGKEYSRIHATQPELKRHKGAMTISAVALYRALTAGGEDAEGLLNSYGEDMEKASNKKLGYKRELVSEPLDRYGVDILSCPCHELAKELGNEKAVLCICHMDKEYSQRFRHIRYERHSAVSEGARACAYRLRFDSEKD